MYTIKKNLVSKEKYALKCPYKMTPKGITVHNTGNDASAENEVAYMVRNDNEVSFHAAVDEDSVVIGIPFNRNAWHAGDGTKGKGNRTTIGIEICHSREGGKKFDNAEKNAAKYIASLLVEYGWDISCVHKHQDWANTACPYRTLKKGWDRFLNMIQDELDSVKEVEPEKVVDEDCLWGQSTTRFTQIVLGLPAVDGVVSNQLNSCKKYLPNMLAVSWEFQNIARGGSPTIKALQKLVGAEQDGYMGIETVKELQRFLKKLGLYKGAIDGIAGEMTVIAWQKYLNMKLAH